MAGGGIMFVRPSVRPSVHLLVCYKTCECDILKTNESIFMQIGKSSPRGKGMKRSILGPGGQRLRLHQTED